MTQKLPLTIIILTHRNDELFMQCLSSAHFADEILISDNNSGNDWTKIKAQRSKLKDLNLKIISHPKEIKNFSELRNELMKQAKNDWVFFLDSDEIIPEGSEAQVAKILKSKYLDACYIKRIDYFHGKPMRWGELRNVWKLRLGKKTELKFLRAIHEIGESSGNMCHSKIILRHYSHDSSTDFLKKIIYYARLEAVEERAGTSAWQAIIEFLFFPPTKFIVNFIFKLGFLDGWRGLIYAVMMSLHSATVRLLIYEQKISKKN